ncbi:MAG: DNA repair protein RecN [Bacteroidetes bacterium]|jgi:DNA repair protein RecN (Recombination protein N)|nr:DNA repair protein RecN [Bacteroidota bacterium]MBT3749379.1 DNA repair protein RecN [Bacteroidota bacterium]MBT4401410.1 DNA repair protein RecN [Bacteroidota bacterium]MBT4410652.1 DNA repair protein RecN [Bacteroidota bacterium]MBT7093656.1 DNA repair protein RecN [Bacteroidota bacterium]
MLASLSIKNYALISSLFVDFSMGLTTITGETGAGKSILMDALSLILGNRADTSVLKDKKQKCIVEARFQVQTKRYVNFFSKHDLDLDEGIILRREIVPSGKSRAFVNDTPVNLPVLKEIGDKLVNIHAQHENLMLNEDQFPLLALDAFAGLTSVRESYAVKYYEYLAGKNELDLLRRKYQEEKRNQDFLEFQLKQLQDARLDQDSQADLEAELEVLEHSEEIQQQVGNTVFSFDEDEQSILSVIKMNIQSLRSVESFYKALSDPIRRMDESYVELKDLIQELSRLLDGVEADPQRLKYIKDRIDLLYSLQQKHQVGDQQGLIDLQLRLEKQLSGIHISSEKITKLEKLVEERLTSLLNAGQLLSDRRLKAKPDFCNEVESILKDLGMPHARFDLSCELLSEPSEKGLDEMEFYFTANKNQELMPVSRVASGGEMSRLMLSVKSLISDSLEIPTLIFDEIDSGVSGDIADKLGRLIRSISKNRQVLNITHLPQVASSGDQHYLVYKYDDDTSTHTAVKELTNEERVVELAKMLSGEKVTDEAILNARQLLN